MTFEELDVALEELETRLERLRALYEQYFLGFEKIEPQVARKDVDRRIYVLRREKIRNTGKRFKLQTIIQRYNTFQQYWQRVCREIENGTYRRHLARAERIMGADKMLTIAARRRFGKSTVEQLAAAADVAGEDDTSPLDEIEAGDLAVNEPFPPEVGTGRSPLPPIPRASSGVPPAPGSMLPGGGTPRTARPSKYESLTLDMDFLDSWDPETQVRSRPEAKPDAKDTTARSVPSAPAPTRPVSPRPLPPRPVSTRPPGPPRMAPPPKPGARVAPPPKPDMLPRIAAAPAPKPEMLTRPAGPPTPAAGAKSSSLSDDRIKELHDKLLRIKRENNESGQVSVESLAKTLRATEEKLRAEHKNRRIEFEVVLRDGKAVVKPKVR